MVLNRTSRERKKFCDACKKKNSCRIKFEHELHVYDIQKLKL